MTTREFLSAVISANLSTDVTTKAQELLAKEDDRNAARRAKPSTAQVENAPLVEAIAAVLTAEPQLTTAIASQVGQSTNKAGALLRQMMSSHGVVQTDVKVKGKGVQKAWYVPTLSAE